MADSDMGRLLEDEIACDPDDVRNYQVLGDWLQRRGDPRGELIALQIAAVRDPAIKPLAARHLRQHAHALLGPLVEFESAGMLELRWRYGYIRHARLLGRRVEAFRALRRHPLARFLHGLVIIPASSVDDAALVECIKTDPPIMLRNLAFGDPELRPDADHETSWHLGCDLARLWRSITGLVRLIVDGGDYMLGDLALPALQRAEFRSNGQGTANAESIVRAKLPSLRHLDVHGDPASDMTSVWIRDGRPTVSRCTGTFASIAPLLDRTDLPRLRHLGIKHCAYLPEVCRALPRSRLLPQLSELDLSGGFLNDAEVEVLCRNATAFRHLTSIDVSHNALSNTAIARLQRIGPVIVSGGQTP